MLAGCPDDVTGRRDRFALALLVYTGLRASEACGLKWRQVDVERGHIVVRGKGEKHAMVGIAPQLLEELARWAPELAADRPVLCRVYKGWRNVTTGECEVVEWDRPMCTGTLRGVLHRASVRVGREIRPHDMRRTLAGILEESGMPVDQIAAVLRHNSTATTERYLKANPRRGVDAMQGFRM